MPQDPRQLQWASINDFTPGVADREYQAAGTLGPWPNGTATVQETFRCRALPNGALGPMPRKDTTFQFEMPSGIQTGTPVNIMGFLIQGRVGGTDGNSGYDVTNWIVGIEWIEQSDGHRHMQVFRVRTWESPPGFDEIIEKEDDFASGAGVHRPVYLESSRVATVAAQLLPGRPCFWWAWWGLGGSFTGSWGVWPNPATPTSLTGLEIATAYHPGPMVVYQGRSLICDRLDYSNGPSPIAWASNENIYFTNNNTAVIASTDASTFTPEDPGEIMGNCVSAANELFVLKYRHGAYVIRGDITFPTVLRVPGIQGAGKMPQIPLASPIGVIYNSEGSGVYVWPGGDLSTLISAQLEPENFTYDLQTHWAYEAYWGRPDFYQDLIFCPPNWVFSYDTKSWWPLEDLSDDDNPAPNGYMYFQRSVDPNSMIAVRAEQFAGESYAFAYNFDLGAVSYQWKSQPISVTVDNYVEVREIVLRATGVAGSTVTVTISSRTDSQTFVYSLDGSSYPRILSKQCHILGGDIQIKFLAESNDADEAAPIIYDFKFGYYEANNLPTQAEV